MVGKYWDSQKKKEILANELANISAIESKMNLIASQLDSFTILPERYRTIHAVDSIGSYFVNKRVDSLKEGINLYEDELLKYQQLHQNNQMIFQNSQMIFQNNQMIYQNNKMLRAQSITNTLLLFKR
ncbi:hypothetical protein [Pedobacter agri]|uniref:hypothetical protein n=1 Tax=Pedobacter agri TaxID=454586 RepID=UPI00292EC546|nr:hypothetical protein [Pedobacter agri]